jgi:tetratricopeptide (TPR) repeat protein
MKNKITLILCSFIFAYSCGQTKTQTKTTAEEYYNQGAEKLTMQNYKEALNDGALSDLNIAIELMPDFSEPYYNRGLAKAKLKDYEGSIIDYNKAIELNPNYTRAYGNRGISKVKLKEYQSAMLDYDKAISLDANYSYAYINRGNLKYNFLNDLNGACLDWNKAKELGDTRANDRIATECK